MKTFINILFIFILSSAYAQEEKALTRDHWIFSLTNGASIPVGSFAHKNAAEAVTFFGRTSHVLGINKAGNGFARTGYNINLELSRMTKSGLLFSIKSGFNSNSQSTREIEKFLKDLYGYPITYTTNKYAVFYLMSGIGYGLNIGDTEIHAKVLGGLAQCNYPSFDASLDPVPWHLEDYPWNLTGFAFGASLDVLRPLGEHFALNLKSSYLQSNFGYTYLSNQLLFGNRIEDTIKWKVLQINVGISYRW